MEQQNVCSDVACVLEELVTMVLYSFLRPVADSAAAAVGGCCRDAGSRRWLGRDASHRQNWSRHYHWDADTKRQQTTHSVGRDSGRRDSGWLHTGRWHDTKWNDSERHTWWTHSRWNHTWWLHTWWIDPRRLHAFRYDTDWCQSDGNGNTYTRWVGTIFYYYYYYY